MAGAFYTLEEAAEKLNKTQKELKQLVKEGKLREFRDGPNLLFKAEEVNALMEELGFVELDDTIASGSAQPQTTESMEAGTEELIAEEPAQDSVELSDELPELDLEPEAESVLEPEPLAESESKPEPEVESQEQIDEVLASEETGIEGGLDDLTDADTALTGQGTSVLGQGDNDYPKTDDTMAETAITAGGTSSEVPLEEIEGDVNLDSFGSGSGLLDLSLQADDTSLGGILDEIYTADGDKAEPENMEAEEPVGADIGEEAAVEPEQIMPQEQVVAQSQQDVEMIAQPMVGMIPDKQANILGMLLFLPLIAVLYTIIIAAAGTAGVVPSILTAVQGFIWYIIGFAIVVTAIGAAASVIMTRESGPRVKKEKPPKVKKEKPPKAEKPKKEKPAKVKKEKKK
jgi:excisionase family DNA binding protein